MTTNDALLLLIGEMRLQLAEQANLIAALQAELTTKSEGAPTQTAE